MDQFSRWSGIAHAHITQHSSKVKLGQVHQLLAAALGHRTYASLRTEDLDRLNQQPRYVLFDDQAVLARATDLGLKIPQELWQEVVMKLRPSGITPFWLTSKEGMHLAARLTFEDSYDDRVHAIKRAMGYPNGHWATSSRSLTDGAGLPETLRFEVTGEVHGYSDTESLATPVTAIMEFRKVGRRMYDTGLLVSIEKSGPPYVRVDEDETGGDVFWMSED